ncbi:NADPH-dependent aldehyde reductase ari1-like isoform x2 [Plakobranchus ocellatus]|uniref:NADPH-dependent aldehyde reductase ari1-like isoform x2 n=1 Tax=Plakobranchus ocellatus TaxID=259542 RepID=A0AAV4DVA7_9GAST|nr:NADPH-dependent aldehyde reductase ari1-like isoform x2 [Plakobranchus ocellatus]
MPSTTSIFSCAGLIRFVTRQRKTSLFTRTPNLAALVSVSASPPRFSTSTMSGELVLVSGATGYLGAWVCKKLQEKGYRVRGTVRSLKNTDKVNFLYNLTTDAKYPLELVEADLLDVESWPRAVKDCKYVIHTASPFVVAKPKNEDELIKPAREGTLNVLRAAADAGTVEHVVVTSSIAAVMDRAPREGIYTEEDWSIPEKQEFVYEKSKTLAEKAAWDFVKELPHGKKFGLTTLQPSCIFGPLLSKNPGTSVDSIAELLEGKIPALPKLYLPCVDVRDVAEAHARAISVDGTVGKRILVNSSTEFYPEMATWVQEEFGPQGYKISTRQLPNAITKLGSCFSTQLKEMRHIGEKSKEFSTERLRTVLGIEPIPVKDTLITMCYSLIERGKVNKTDKYRGPPSN